MSRPNPVYLTGFLVAVLLALGGVSIFKGALLIGKHEGDTMHLLQIIFRMAEGQWPHLDFMTPIGILAFLPIVLFVDLGYGVGFSILLSQVLVALVLIPAVVWVGYSRLSPLLALLFGLIIMVLALALVHGEAQRSISISMHYNRWAWAIAFLAITIAVLPVRARENQVIDGILVGLFMVTLVLIKVTYFAAFAPGVILAMVLRKQFRALAFAVAAGFVVVLIFTAFAGVAFWTSYLGDLLTVSGSDIRQRPGEPFGAVLGAPKYIGASLIGIIGVILLRQAREAVGGLVLLILLPGFYFVTFQNFGNDPQWLWLLAVLLLSLRPEGDVRNGFGWDMRNALTMTAVATMALGAPSFFNLVYSPFRHVGIDITEYKPMLPQQQLHHDLRTLDIRAVRVDGRVALDGPGSGLEAYAVPAKRKEYTRLAGERLPLCEIELGMVAWMDTIVSDLKKAGLAEGKRLFAADVFSSHWLYGSFEPLERGAPWYYGNLSGIESADYLLVPLCPVSPKVRKQILGAVETREDLRMTEIRRTPLYILMEFEKN